jgi:chorismate mutase
VCRNKSTSPNSVDALANCFGVFFCAKDLMMTPIEQEGLQTVREEIDQVDRSLVGLIAARLDLARQARVLKDQDGLVGQDPAREAEVVRQAAEAARDMGLNPEIIRDVFWRLISLSQWADSSDTKHEA